MEVSIVEHRFSDPRIGNVHLRVTTQPEVGLTVYEVDAPSARGPFTTMRLPGVPGEVTGEGLLVIVAGNWLTVPAAGETRPLPVLVNQEVSGWIGLDTSVMRPQWVGGHWEPARLLTPADVVWSNSQGQVPLLRSVAARLMLVVELIAAHEIVRPGAHAAPPTTIAQIARIMGIEVDAAEPVPFGVPQ